VKEVVVPPEVGDMDAVPAVGVPEHAVVVPVPPTATLTALLSPPPVIASVPLYVAEAVGVN